MKRLQNNGKDLTAGKITPQIVKFTIPVVLDNLFQLTYNAVDSTIAGRFAGEEALAEVQEKWRGVYI